MDAIKKASKELGEIVDALTASREPILIKGKRHSAVLVPEETWRGIQETLFLCSKPGMRKSISKGLATPVSRCKKSLDW